VNDRTGWEPISNDARLDKAMQLHRLKTQQAKVLAEFLRDNPDVRLPQRRSSFDQRDEASLRGIPVVGGRRDALPRSLAGIGQTDPWKGQRERDYKTRSGSNSTCTLSLHQILRKSNGCCYLCGSTLTVRTLRVEHVIPLNHGGTHTDENVAAACTPCNSRKGVKFVAFMVATRKPVYL
jgi:5-methylcytosine-specific restriction endonuclease McrA